MSSSNDPTAQLINVQRHIAVEGNATTGILQQHIVMHAGELMLAENFASIDTKEPEVVAALVSMGWAPPEQGRA